VRASATGNEPERSQRNDPPHLFFSDLLEGVRGSLPEAENLAHEIKGAVGIMVIGQRLGKCGANRNSGVMEELIL
jgi:hypothetical protein